MEAVADLPVLRLAVRLRWVYFALVVVLLAAGYNGQWRTGRDSALYRSVAQSLAAGEGYKFRGERERHVYQGLPRMLAGIDRVFGSEPAMRPGAAQAVMLGLALLTLYVVYHLIRTRYPRWVAVCVTTGVGINPFFVRHAHELMTDIPFMLGVCLTLLGLAKLGKYQMRRWALWGSVALLGGMLAISMRPTFIPLAAAFALSCIIGVARTSRWPRYGIGIGLLVLLLLAYWQFDPRREGGGILYGRYEEIAVSHAQQIGGTDWWRGLAQTADRDLPESMFGAELVPPFGAILALILIGGAVAMMRRNLLWGLYVLTTLIMMLLLGGSKPRYFLMVLPLLLAEWAMLAAAIASSLRRWRYAPSAAILLVLGLATVVNLVRSADFVREQRGWTRQFDSVPFQEICNDGRMKHLIKLAELIAGTVPPGQKVLADEVRVLTFLSGRDVYHPSEIQPPRVNSGWTRKLEGRRITWCVFGSRVSPDKRINHLIKSGMIAIDRKSLVAVDGMYLVRILSVAEHRQLIEQARKQKTQARLEARRTGKIPLTTTRPSTRPVRPPRGTRSPGDAVR